MKKTGNQIHSKVVVLPLDNIDTDQIIPARFLKTVSKDGFGQWLFADWRFDQNNIPNPDFILNQSEAIGTEILMAGENFGCGSSREHAPWALKDFGFNAIIARSFADIFRNNAIKNGILPLALPADDHSLILDTLQEIPGGKITIHIGRQEIILPTGIHIPFQMDPYSKKAILEGVNEFDYLLSHQDQITAFEMRISSSITGG